MTISEAIAKENDGTTAIKKYAAVNVGFKNFAGEDDETQLNVSNNLYTAEGTEELEELFESLCEELWTSHDKVTYVRAVTSADSEAELVEMGY